MGPSNAANRLESPHRPKNSPVRSTGVNWPTSARPIDWLAPMANPIRLPTIHRSVSLSAMKPRPTASDQGAVAFLDRVVAEQILKLAIHRVVFRDQ